MKLQYKISLLLSIIFGIIILSFLSYQYIRIREKKLLYLENVKAQELVIDKVLQLNRIKYEQLINDNSGWDDMVRFAAKPDHEWAKDNVDFFVNSFKLSFVLVYNKEMSLAYHYGDSGSLKLLHFPDQKMIQSSFADSAFIHHFQYCGDDLMEIFGATIVPAADSDNRETPPQGYLFIGRKWSKEYLAEHDQATSYKAELIRGSDLSNYTKDRQRNYFTRNMLDYSGQIIAVLVFSKKDSVKEDMAIFLYLSLLVTLIAFTAMVVFLFYFRKIILVPLSKISTTLNTHNPEHVESLNSSTDEFQKLGALILQFFWQEEVLKKNNAELHEINGAKDKLFSIIAHDLKNPVGNILIISELLDESMKNQEQENSAELLGMIGSQARETLSLLETLFDWAKSQTGQMNYKPEILNLKRAADQVIGILKPAATLKNITVESLQSEETQVFADPNMLSVILRNLTTNAIKYTNPGGTIRISAAILPDETVITVSDDGIGMAQETQAKLFLIDTNMTTPGTANEKGTGLGLVISKEFVEKHGGHIKVKSEPGKGSQFIFSLPSVEVNEDLRSKVNSKQA
ncbi:MAG: ATP-binding protein [Bacteroidota bacterium]|nr:ATP-binding protein [Bacteroidota bacterium]